MNWFAAMLCLTPLLALDSPAHVWGVRLPSGQKLRTWLVMFCASLGAWLVRADNPAPVYAVIDGLSAYLVLRRPLGEMQRAIGALFIGMMAVDLGFTGACWLQPGPHDFGGYFAFNGQIGWLQWACLALWGVGDALAGYLVFGQRGSSHAIPDRDGA